MSRLRLVVRLAARDLSRRGVETLLLFLALAVAATTLTIALVLHGQTAAPYAETRARTAGPDVVVSLFPQEGRSAAHADATQLDALASRPEVAAHSPAFPVTWAPVTAAGVTGVAEVQGRDSGSSPVDRPYVVSGRWVDGGGVVVERAFAEALGVAVGDSVVLGGHRTPVVGVAVSAALPPYPQLCTIGCILDQPGWMTAEPGLMWASRATATSLATPSEPVVWFQYLKLHDPDAAPAFAERFSAHGPPSGAPQLDTWQEIAARHAEQLRSERTVVVFGGTLLGILALATLVVLVGGRMTDEVRRIGTLKAVGAAPGFVTRLLLASYLAIGVLAAVTGVLVGRVVAPHLVTRSAGLLGRLGATSVTLADQLLVVAAVLLLVILASAVPAWRAARTSTVRALADAGRTPHRGRLLVPLSRRLPVPALLGLRLAARRPRRAVLTTLSVAVAVCGSTVVLYAQASLRAEHNPGGGPADPLTLQLRTVMTAMCVLLALMAAINLVFITRANAVDARVVLAVTRAVGASPGEAAAGLGIAQLFPAVVGLVLGTGCGVLLFQALSSASPPGPPWGQLAALGVLTLVLVVLLTALPARLEARRPLAGVLREA
jgi:ABC-type lipoprotein release transport system permease subunit